MTVPTPWAVLHAVNSVVDPLARRGWLAPLPVGVGVVQLDVTGRRSGEPRPRSVLAARVGGRMVVGTVRSGSDWIANLIADAHPTVSTRGGPRRVHTELRRTPVANLVVMDVMAPSAN